VFYRTSRADLFAVSAGALLWGTTGVVVRIVIIHSGLSPVSAGFYRLALSAVALLAGARGALRAVRASPRAVIVGGVGLGIYQALYFIAVQDIGVGIATLISLGIAPVMLNIGDAVRQCDRHRLGILAAAIIGLTLISVGSTSAGPRPTLGLLASIATGLCYAGSTVLNQRLAAVADPLALTFSASVLGAVALFPVALFVGAGVPLAPIPLIGLGYLGVVATALAYWLFYRGLRTTSAGTAAILTLLEALGAAVLATIVLHEPLSVAMIVGALLLCGAIIGLYR
jgi:drug/metabolite transporter (DMT)-like permease